MNQSINPLVNQLSKELFILDTLVTFYGSSPLPHEVALIQHRLQSAISAVRSAANVIDFAVSRETEQLTATI